MRSLVLLFAGLASVSSAFSQRRVDAGQMYERVYAIVPMTGSGTWNDPKRPMFAPVPNAMTPENRKGIIAFNQVTSDDGNFALVEIVAATKADLATTIAPIAAAVSQTPGVQLFQRGSSTPAQVQTAFQALKKNFDITKFRVVVP